MNHFRLVISHSKTARHRSTATVVEINAAVGSPTQLISVLEEVTTWAYKSAAGAISATSHGEDLPPFMFHDTNGNAFQATDAGTCIRLIHSLHLQISRATILVPPSASVRITENIKVMMMLMIFSFPEDSAYSVQIASHFPNLHHIRT